MKKLFTLLLWSCATATVLAQTSPPPSVRELVKEGVRLNDEERYAEAIAKYQEALKLYPDNVSAQTELALTYESSGKYAESIAICRNLIERKPALPEVDPSLFVTYGNALDESNKPKDAVKAYQQGIARFPSYGMLYFNLGLTQLKLRQLPAGQQALQLSAERQPQHRSTPYYLGATAGEQGQRIPALLALLRFIQLEPEGPRAVKAGAMLSLLLSQGVRKNEGGGTTISISSATLKQADKEKGDDNFAHVDMLLTLGSALDNDSTYNKLLDPTTRAASKLSGMCRALAELSAKRQPAGFTWRYYVPHFIALNEAGHMPALVAQVRKTQPDTQADASQWQQAHPAEVQALQKWVAAYVWPVPAGK